MIRSVMDYVERRKITKDDLPLWLLELKDALLTMLKMCLTISNMKSFKRKFAANSG